MSETIESYEHFLRLLDRAYLDCVEAVGNMLTTAARRAKVFDYCIRVLGANSEALNLQQKVAVTMLINYLWSSRVHQFLTAEDAAKLVEAIDGAWTDGEHARPVHLMQNTRDLICARFSLELAPASA